MTKNYLEFGALQKDKKKKYEFIMGNLYDWYMLPRYFNDIFLLNKFTHKKNLKKLSKSIHHIDDLKFNFINFILIKSSKTKIFYEYGQTLFEKIFYIKFFSQLLKTNINSKIKWAGNDTSEWFNFFCRNFYKDTKIEVYKEINFKNINKSLFFAKGVTLLYTKENLIILKKIIEKSNCGSFDISIKNKNNIEFLNTGKKLYYPKIKIFFNLLEKSKKKIIFKNIKVKREKIYLEIIYGNKKIMNNFLKLHQFYTKKYKNNSLITKILNLKVNFKSLNEVKYQLSKYF